MNSPKKFKSILIVDDNEVDTYIAQHLLEEFNITDTISTASNGQEALDYLKQLGPDQPDVIFLDVRMPVMNGFEFLEHYPEIISTSGKQSLLFMLTSSGDPVDIDKARNNPLVKKYFSKPLSPEIIRWILEEC